MTEFGYAGEILKVDLSAEKITRSSSVEYTSKFLGGRGIAARLYWEMVQFEKGAMEPENCLICAAGPVTGFFGLAGCRWIMGGKSPARQPEAFSYGNLGGKWGPALKGAGYDALAVQGKAEKPVYLFIHEGTVEFKDAKALWGMSAFETANQIREFLGKGVSVLSIGPAAENRVVFATALADGGASVSAGLGSVMGSKNLKAVVVAGDRKPEAAYPDRLQHIVKQIRQMRGSVFEGPSPWSVPGLTETEYCYGCGIGCNRQTYMAEKGQRFKSVCQATGVYTRPAMEYYGPENEIRMKAIRLCDGYGLDTAVMAPLILWLKDCYDEGIINEKGTGLPLSSFGSLEFIETLTRKISLREGFGDVLARGTLQAAESLGAKAKNLLVKYIATPSNETKDYDPRLILTTALLYATEPRRPVSQLHAVAGNTLIMWVNWMRGIKGAFLSTEDLREIAIRFWGGPLAADYSTYDGKALAAKTVQNRVYVQESLVLCDVHWPMMITSANYSGGHVGDPSLESRIYSAITGRKTEEAELYRIGERIVNLQRAILLRQGWGGRKGDMILDYFFRETLKKGEIFYNSEAQMPGPDSKIISKLEAVVDRQEFEKMKSEYYRLRGWDVETGFPTKVRLEQLGLQDITGDLEKRDLLGREIDGPA